MPKRSPVALKFHSAAESDIVPDSDCSGSPCGQQRSGRALQIGGTLPTSVNAADQASAAWMALVSASMQLWTSTLVAGRSPRPRSDTRRHRAAATIEEDCTVGSPGARSRRSRLESARPSWARG